MKTAKALIAISKSMLAFQPDINTSMYLAATDEAGRAGLLASAVRCHESLPVNRFLVMAATERFSKNDLTKTIYPWLEQHSLCDLQRTDKQVTLITSLILTYDQILNAVEHLWEDLSPHSVERACVQAHIFCDSLPVGKTELYSKLTADFGEQNARLALELVDAYHLINKVSRGLLEPIYYTNNLWKTSDAGSAAQSISLLNATDKEILVSLINRVRDYQGLPEQLLSDFLRKENGHSMLELALRTGLLERTQIKTIDGEVRSFLISPHFYLDLAAEHGNDLCDRVKIFLDSIRNGQHFGQPATGKILNPMALLNALLNKGWVGPATAIGSGYVLPEKAGIIRVDRDANTTWKYKLNLVQTDTVTIVRNLVAGGVEEPGAMAMRAANLQPESGFMASETIRAAAVATAEFVDEAEADLMRMMREQECRT